MLQNCGLMSLRLGQRHLKMSCVLWRCSQQSSESLGACSQICRIARPHAAIHQCQDIPWLAKPRPAFLTSCSSMVKAKHKIRRQLQKPKMNTLNTASKTRKHLATLILRLHLGNVLSNVWEHGRLGGSAVRCWRKHEDLALLLHKLLCVGLPVPCGDNDVAKHVVCKSVLFPNPKQNRKVWPIYHPEKTKRVTKCLQIFQARFACRLAKYFASMAASLAAVCWFGMRSLKTFISCSNLCLRCSTVASETFSARARAVSSVSRWCRSATADTMFLQNLQAHKPHAHATRNAPVSKIAFYISETYKLGRVRIQNLNLS